MGSSSTKINKTLETNEKSLNVFEKLLLYGYTDEKLAWETATKFPNLHKINHAIDYIERYQRRNEIRMDKIYGDYFRLLLKTRMYVLQEDTKCTVIDDDTLSYKERITWCRQWIKTDIIKTLTDEWDSVYDNLINAKVAWNGHQSHDAQQITQNITKMYKTLTLRLNDFQMAQNEISEQLKYAMHHVSHRKMNNALNEINDCLDAYATEGKSVLMEATKADETKTDDDNENLKQHLLTVFWNIFIGLSLKEKSDAIFDKNKLNRKTINEIDTVYWLLLFNTRRKMKILTIKSIIRKKDIENCVNNSMENRSECIEHLLTFDSTICSYNGFEEWNAMQNVALKLRNMLKMSSMMRICKSLIIFQKNLKNTQQEISKNINETEKCKTKETLNKVLLEINTNLDIYIQNAQNVLNVIEKTSKQCFADLYVI